MFFANTGVPPKLLKGLVIEIDKVITEPLVLIDSVRYSYVLPIKNFGIPQSVILYEITNFEKFKEKIVDKFNADLFQISAKSTTNGKSYIAFVLAAQPFKNLDLSLQYGFKSKSKHLKGK